MLIRLFGKNFRSLKDEFDLSLVAADLKRSEDCDRGVIRVDIRGLPEPLALLRCVAVYGANASGKSTVLTAARALNWLVGSSSQQAKPDGPIPPYEPFILNRSSQKAAVRLGCDVVHDGAILRYEVAYDKSSIKTESLSRLDGEESIDLIKRAATGRIHGGLIDDSEANKLYVKEMQPNVAVLSKLAQHGPHKGSDSAVPYRAAILKATTFRDYSIAAVARDSTRAHEQDRFADDGDYQAWIMSNLIRPSDLGICDVRIRRESIGIPSRLRERLAKISDELDFRDHATIIEFVHQGDVRRAMDLSRESAGTRKLLNISGDWWTLANEPATILADEISASLHPRLLDRLVRAVNDVQSSKARSQLIFTTHDTGLMEGRDGLPPALRRDQIYFTKKDEKGVSRIYSLAEFKEEARPVHNIRKRYLSGLYGAIPDVQDVSL